MFDEWPQPNARSARVAGGLWLGVIAVGIVGFVLTRSMFVAGNPLLSAQNVLSREVAFRVSIVAHVVSDLLYLALTVVLVELFRPVQRTMSILAGAFGGAGCVAAFLFSVFQLIGIDLLRAQSQTLLPDQVRLLVHFMSPLTIQRLLFSTWIVFGLQCVLIGQLIVRSHLLPRMLGILLAIGGSTYVLGTLVTVIEPQLAAIMFRIIEAAAFVGEGSVAVWLTIRGIDLARWTGPTKQPGRAIAAGT